MDIIVTKTDDKLVIKNDSWGNWKGNFILAVIFSLFMGAGTIAGFSRSPEIRCQRLEKKVVNCTGTPIRFLFLRGEPQAYGRALGITQEQGEDSTNYYLQSASGLISIGRSQASAIQKFLSSPGKNELVASSRFRFQEDPMFAVVLFVFWIIVYYWFIKELFTMTIVEEYTFDLSRHQLFKTEKKLFKVVNQEFSLQGIDVKYCEEEDDEGDPVFNVKVLLPGGKEEKVLSYYTYAREKAWKDCQDLRSFLGLPPDRSISAEQTPAEKPDTKFP